MNLSKVINYFDTEQKFYETMDSVNTLNQTQGSSRKENARLFIEARVKSVFFGVPLEAGLAIKYALSSVGHTFGYVANGFVRTVTYVRPTEYLSNLQQKCSTGKDVSESIFKTVKFAVGAFSTLFFGAFSPAMNITIHNKYGILPKIDNQTQGQPICPIPIVNKTQQEEENKNGGADQKNNSNEGFNLKELSEIYRTIKNFNTKVDDSDDDKDFDDDDSNFSEPKNENDIDVTFVKSFNGDNINNTENDGLNVPFVDSKKEVVSQPVNTRNVFTTPQTPNKIQAPNSNNSSSFRQPVFAPGLTGPLAHTQNAIYSTQYPFTSPQRQTIGHPQYYQQYYQPYGTTTSFGQAWNGSQIVYTTMPPQVQTNGQQVVRQSENQVFQGSPEKK